MNQRGEITTAVAIGIAAVALLVGTIAPSLNPFNNLFGAHSAPSAANQKATWTTTDEVIKPVLLRQGDTVAVGQQIERHYDTGTEERPVKLTLMQRIGRFFAGLTTTAFIFILVSLLFFGGVPIVWAFHKYAVIKQALKNTVAAIRDLPEDQYKAVTPKLAAKHDRRDRKVIDKIKMELQ